MIRDLKIVLIIKNMQILDGILIGDLVIRRKGDDHNFLVGLEEHFRNILVCKDESTLDLLQVSGNVREKYAEQAKRFTSSFLLSGLNILNQCDLAYKTSKNQRLHVEICLMKLSQLNRAFKLSEPPTEPEEVKKKVA